MQQAAVQALRAQLQTMLPSLRQEFGIAGLWIVGSRARGDHETDSDLDLVVEFDNNDISLLGFCKVEQLLSDRLGVNVDLVERGAVRARVAKTMTADAIAV